MLAVFKIRAKYLSSTYNFRQKHPSEECERELQVQIIPELFLLFATQTICLYLVSPNGDDDIFKVLLRRVNIPFLIGVLLLFVLREFDVI